MSIVTDNTKTLENALARIATIEAEKAHLLKVIKERKLAGYVGDIGEGRIAFTLKPFLHPENCKPVYYISDEYDSAGFLITPEVKIESQ